MNFFGRLQSSDFDALHFTNLRSLVDYCVLTIARKIDYLMKLKSSVPICLPSEVLAKIVHLLIKRRKITEETICFLLNPFITFLDLTNSQVSNLSIIGEKCPNLSILCLRGCLGISDSSLIQMSKSCTNLMGLSLMYNKKITDKGIEKLVENCKKLKQLDLSWCSRLTNSCLELISQHCVHLEELSVACCKLISGSGIECVVQHCKNIKLLELRSCNSIENVEFPPSTSLQYLDLSHCPLLGNETMEYLSGCQYLSSLDINTCPKLTDCSVSKLLHSSELVFLNFSNCNFQNLSFRTPNLTNLNLSGCVNLSLSTFQSLAQCHSLTELQLRGCTSITDECIQAFTCDGSSHSLVSLDLSRCTSLSNESISTLVQRCKYLRFLDISWCPQLNDRAICYISQHINTLVQLESIKAFGCSISGPSIHQLKLKIKELNLNLTIHCIMNERDWSTVEAI